MKKSTTKIVNSIVTTVGLVALVGVGVYFANEAGLVDFAKDSLVQGVERIVEARADAKAKAEEEKILQKMREAYEAQSGAYKFFYSFDDFLNSDEALKVLSEN